MREASIGSTADLEPLVDETPKYTALGEPCFRRERFASSKPDIGGDVSLSQHLATDLELYDRPPLLRNDAWEIGKQTEVERHIDPPRAP